MKYWTLACKLELLKKGEDPAKHNSLYLAIFVCGVFLNVVAACVQAIEAINYSEEVQEALRIAKSSFTIPLIASCIFLADAFRRFRKSNSKKKQVINNR
jgi:hypothetical protein